MDVTIACVCEGAPHPNDRVTLRDRLDFRTVRAMRNEIKILNSGEDRPSSAEILATLTEAYLYMGIESWSVVDAKGKPLLPSRKTITARLLEANPEEAGIVGDAADDLYNDVVILPLAERASSFSPPTPTAESTSAPTDLPMRRPKPLKPSSTSTTRTAGIVRTSSLPAGDSSTLQNSVSAA